MAYDARVDLSAAMLQRDILVDVDTAYPTGSGTWVPVSGVSKHKVTIDTTMKDSTVGSMGGATAQQKTADGWAIEMTLKRAPQESDLDAYDVGQEHLRLRSLEYGAANLVKVRWFEANGSGYPITEAWEGVAAVSWGEVGEAFDDIREAEVKLAGHGARTPSTFNPASA